MEICDRTTICIPMFPPDFREWSSNIQHVGKDQGRKPPPPPPLAFSWSPDAPSKFPEVSTWNRFVFVFFQRGNFIEDCHVLIQIVQTIAPGMAFGYCTSWERPVVLPDGIAGEERKGDVAGPMPQKPWSFYDFAILRCRNDMDFSTRRYSAFEDFPPWRWGWMMGVHWDSPEIWVIVMISNSKIQYDTGTDLYSLFETHRFSSSGDSFSVFCFINHSNKSTRVSRR